MNQLISKGKKILILTQSNDLIRAFLYDNPGKWTAIINEKYWPISLKISECIDKVQFKEKGQSVDVGLNAIGNTVIFSKLPVANIHPSYTIIQTPFKSPIIEISEYACHSSNVKGSVFFPDDPEKWRYVFDVIGDTETKVIDQIKYVKTERVVVAKAFIDPIELCVLHDVNHIMVSKHIKMIL